MTDCIIKDCGKKAHAKGFCGSHYMRLRKHGHPLGGGPGPTTKSGEPIRFTHEVALHHTGDECLIWPFGKNNRGYGQFKINGKTVPAHRYVCELAHGAPPTSKHEASHGCGKGHESCIAPGHLSWKTHTENMADKLDHGTHIRGERHGSAKLTEADVREILAMKGIRSQRELAASFGVSQPTVASIHAGHNWAWLFQDAKEIAA